MRMLWAAVATGSAVFALLPEDAHACGCFAPPDPSKPIVQAGERIVFAAKDGKITAHIQIQYEGSAEDFAWLIPLPAVPEVKVGVEELFAQIEARTAPSFLLNTTGFCGGGGISLGCADDSLAAGGEYRDPKSPDPNVAIVVSTAGPYDFAVLDASSKQPMLDWLSTHRYFVPSGTQDAMDPYIRPNSYFLAVKLQAGQSAGDLQPIVLEYESQYPMIPIILTAVAANPDMGVLVWILGDTRAVPRNYQHVVINDEYIDWVGGAANYSDVVRRAVDEGKDHHAWVTEYAGTTAPMVGVLDQSAVLGNPTVLRQTTDAVRYVGMLQVNNFTWAALRPIFERHFPMPAAAREAGVSEDDYYQSLAANLATFDPQAMFDPVALTDEIWERIVTPTLEAAQMFHDHSYMSRLYTLLSPEEMTADPVFSFNPDLPDVTNLHTATMTNTCEDDYPFELVLEDGRRFRLKQQADWSTRVAGPLTAPMVARVEVLREEGQPEIVVDNRSALMAANEDELNGGGCSAGGRRRGVAIVNGLFWMLMIVAGRRLMRRA